MCSRENSCSPGIWLEGCTGGDVLSCAVLLSWAGVHTVHLPQHPCSTQGLPVAQETEPRLSETQNQESLPLGVSLLLNNRVSTSFQKMLEEAWKKLWLSPHPGWDRLF